MTHIDCRTFYAAKATVYAVPFIHMWIEKALFILKECDAILADKGVVSASPELTAANENASLIHEAALGKIAGDQILNLRTLGLTEEEAEQKIIDGFLK